jgi:hypothetical protein
MAEEFHSWDHKDAFFYVDDQSMLLKTIEEELWVMKMFLK